MAALHDALPSMAPTLEAIHLADIELVGARDFSGVPYTILSTTSTVRNAPWVLAHMIASRGDVIGQRSFLADDGRVIAVDVFQSREPHTAWFYDGDTAHSIVI